MNSSIHNKGVMILAGFVGELVGRDIPISFNANIVFEQLYSGIDKNNVLKYIKEKMMETLVGYNNILKKSKIS